MTDTTLPDRPVPQPSHRASGSSDPAEARGNPLRLAILAGLLLLAGVRGGWSLLVMIGALVVMIFLHELGHYLTAKWAGMKVTEFFIGFGPKIWSFHRGETEYGLKVIPAGAYVKIIGMHNLDEFDEADADRTYMSKPFWRRLSVAVAGSTMHFILAAVSFFLAFGFVGLPGGGWATSEAELDALETGSAWTVSQVSEGSGAADAGVEVGDRIVSVDGVDVDGFAQFGEVVSARPDELVDVVLVRDGAEVTLRVAIGHRDGEGGEDRGFFGVGPRILDSTVGAGEAVGDTVGAFTGTVGQTFDGLFHILSPSGLADLGQAAFTPDDDGDGGAGGGGRGTGTGGSGRASDESGSEPQAAGIVRISSIGADLLGQGEFGYFLGVFATINIFIGIFNLVPLLPLDGGHVAIACYEKVRSLLQGGRAYHVDVVKLLPITYAAVLVLAFLGVSTLVLDTRTLVGG